MNDQGTAAVDNAQIAEFERAVRKLTPRFLCHWSVRGLDPSEVEDLIQDAVTNVYSALVRQRRIKHMEAYLKRAFVNRVVTRHRAPPEEETGWGAGEDDERPSLEDLASVHSPQPDLGKQVMDQDCLDRALDQVRRRSPDKALALELKILGYTGRSTEMAEALDRTPAAANTFLSNAWEEFRTIYRRLCGDD